MKSTKYMQEEEARIADLQNERTEINARLLNADSYNFPHERSKDARRIKEIRKQLNEYYIKRKGL